jgi:7-cyano-7-deazaguanine synthase
MKDDIFKGMDSAVILLSGGLDSTTLLHWVAEKLRGKPLYACSFHYGQKHSRELDVAQWQARAAGVREHRMVDLSVMSGLIAGASALTDAAVPVPDLEQLTPEQRSQPPTYVPNRNMVLLAVAAAFAEARGVRDVFYGAHAQDRYGYWDCTVDFLHRINDVLCLNRRSAVTVRAPLVDLTKAEVLKIGLSLGVDYARTWSCYRGGERPCGRCPTCVERATAFRECGSIDPLTADADRR